MIGLRRRIAERLSAAWTEIPHITYVDAVDATDSRPCGPNSTARHRPTRRPV